MANTSPGRAGVAPSRERGGCPVCGHRMPLHYTRDGNPMCYPCWQSYEAELDDEATRALAEVVRDRAAPHQSDAAATVPDELAPWYRAFIRVALEDKLPT